MLQYLDTIIAFAVIMLGVSLLITILNQMISALLGYRGTNLLWGIKTLLGTIEPNLSTKAEVIATEVLRKPIISDSIFSKFAKDGSVLGWVTKRWKLASAITPQELVRGLNHVAQTMVGTKDEQPTADLIHEVLAQVDPEADRKAKMVLETLQKLSPDTAIQMDKVVQELETTMQGSIGKVEAWFDTVMKRASQRFTLQMRIWTIVFAVLFAFGAHLDSIKLLQQLWASPGLRTSLVADRETILREASIVLGAQSGTVQNSGPSVAPQILVDAMKKLIENEKAATTGLPVVPRFNNLDEAVSWLRTGLKVEESRKEILIAAYENLVLTELKGHAERIKQDLDKSGFQLIPKPWPGLHYEWPINVLGILVTAGFLSLGAPFWFNILRSLSNLRPLLANMSAKTEAGSTQS
jgi:hypothetical protein